MVNSYEVYAVSINGALHNMGSVLAKSSKSAICKFKKYNPEYSDFTARKGEEMTKQRFYDEGRNVYQDWSSI